MDVSIICLANNTNFTHPIFLAMTFYIAIWPPFCLIAIDGVILIFLKWDKEKVGEMFSPMSVK